MTTATLLPSIKRRSAYRLDPVEAPAAERARLRGRDRLDPLPVVLGREHERPDGVRGVGPARRRRGASGPPAAGGVAERDHVLACRELRAPEVGVVVRAVEIAALRAAPAAVGGD